MKLDLNAIAIGAVAAFLGAWAFDAWKKQQGTAS